MQTTSPIIELAKERALLRFAQLAEQMVQEGADGIRRAIREDVSSDRKNLLGAQAFLMQDGAAFRNELEVRFRGYLDRAMQTMYTDMREGLQGLSADTLSLIDDETVERQIEVDRVVQRLRAADQESLGRLSVMISQLHND
ncbi:MAG: hypothetical protein JWQ23_3144, partial [Herminiimonas sp.]|nr:hypothetical protein [Herminiimonas sp.]